MLFAPFSIYFCVIALLLNIFCTAYSLNQNDSKDTNRKYGMEQFGMKLLNISDEEKSYTVNISTSTQGRKCTSDDDCGYPFKCAVLDDGAGLECSRKKCTYDADCEIPLKCADLDDGEGLVCSECDCGPEGSFKGECRFDGYRKICNCMDGFVEKDGKCEDDEDKDVCEVKNPCKNGGTCEPESEKGYECICMKGYTGTNCEHIKWCKDNKGICGATPCEYDSNTETGYCFCENGLFFDVKAKKCKEIDKCLRKRIKGECNGAHETCNNGDCICEENHAYNDKGDCEPDFCWKNSRKSRCGMNMICIEEYKSFSCSCYKGYYQIGGKCVEADECTPGVLNCEQKCTNGKCDCFTGFILNEDTSTCSVKESESDCSLDCGKGTCVKEGTVEKCDCPQISHVLVNNTCADKCKAGLIKIEECPTGCLSDESFGYRCDCTGKYDVGDDGVHCRDKQMCSEGGGTEDCLSKNANCRDNFALPKGYTCECKFGFKKNPKIDVCEHMCKTADCDKYQALCTLNVLNKPECICPPLLIKDSSGKCNQLAKYSYIGNFLVPKRKYEVITAEETGKTKSENFKDINYAKLLMDFEDSMKHIFDDYKGTSILNCTDNGDDWNCFLEIKLEKDPEGKINIVSTPSVCLPLSDESHCLIQPDFVTRKRTTDDAEVFHKTHPCEKSVNAKLCGSETQCEISAPGFKCLCKPGYFRRTSYEPAKNVLIDVCEDIDECLNSMICPNTTTCFNLPGDYTCICIDGYRLEEGNSVKKDGCRGFCELDPCKNGICEMTNHTVYCRCYEGFSGPFCQDKIAVKTNISTLLIGIIIFCAILNILLIGILGYVCLQKRKSY